MKVPHLVVFDLDHTLLAGDSSELWAGEMARLGWIDDIDTFQAKHRVLMDTYATGNLDMEAYLTLNLEPLKARPYVEVAKIAETFVREQLLGRLYEDGLSLISQLRIAGHHLLMISASEIFLVEPVAQALGFDGVIGIDPELKDNCFTGRALLPMSYQAGKVHHCRGYAEQMELSDWPVAFYSDSHNDIPLLDEADAPVVVNPNERLAAVAKARGWPVMQLN